MYLEFTDGAQLKCDRIFGGPRVINGIERDVLSIEITPEDKTLDQIKEYFKNKNNMVTLYYRATINEDEPRKEIGQGYMKFIDARVETRRLKFPPGQLRVEEFIELYIINIAQLTYAEYQEYLMRLENPDYVDENQYNFELNQETGDLTFEIPDDADVDVTINDDGCLVLTSNDTEVDEQLSRYFFSQTDEGMLMMTEDDWI